MTIALRPALDRSGAATRLGLTRIELTDAPLVRKVGLRTTT